MVPTSKTIPRHTGPQSNANMSSVHEERRASTPFLQGKAPGRCASAPILQMKSSAGRVSARFSERKSGAGRVPARFLREKVRVRRLSARFLRGKVRGRRAFARPKKVYVPPSARPSAPKKSTSRRSPARCRLIVPQASQSPSRQRSVRPPTPRNHCPMVLIEQCTQKVHNNPLASINDRVSLTKAKGFQK